MSSSFRANRLWYAHASRIRRFESGILCYVRGIVAIDECVLLAKNACLQTLPLISGDARLTAAVATDIG